MRITDLFAVVVHAGSLGRRLGKVSACFCDCYREMCPRECLLSAKSGHSQKSHTALRTGFSNALQTILKLHQASVPIVAETDATIFPCGMRLIDELENYWGAGLSAADTLKTATSAAAAMGAGNKLGAIAPGRLADLVIIDGDPLAELSDLLNVTAVMKNGRYYRLEDLLKPPVIE